MPTTITDDFMKQMMMTTRGYTAVIIKAGPEISRPDAMQIIWEHGRRNFSLRAEEGPSHKALIPLFQIANPHRLASHLGDRK